MDEEKSIKKEEEKKKHPSLPPNYVSLVQLQERWLQRKQEEEEHKKKKAESESLNQKNLKANKGVLKNPQNSRNREPFVKGHHVSAHWVNLGVKGQEIDRIGGVKGMQIKINGEKSEAKKKEKRHKVRKGLNGDGRNQSSLQSEKSFGIESEEIDAKDDCNGRKLKDSKDKNAQVELMEKRVDGSSVSNESSLCKGKDGSEIPEYEQKEKVSEDFGTKIGGKFRGLSLDDRRGGNVTPSIVTPGRKWQYKKRFVSKEMQKPSDSKLVWVRKGEMSNDSGHRKLEAGMDEDAN